MTIDQAIKELTLVVGKWQYGASNSRDSALKLGIEALKYAKTSRDPSGTPPYPLLPGETK